MSSSNERSDEPRTKRPDEQRFNELMEARRLRVIEDRVALAIAKFFVRNPELVGFYLQDPAGFGEVLNPAAGTELSILDVALSLPLGDKAHDDMRGRIRDTIVRIVAERPEAFDMLRDRTFARAFH
jgi:hypothetical protein